MSTLTRPAAFIALATCAAAPAYAQTSRQSAEMVTLERPAAFEIAPNTGSLKESVQKGQQLVCFKSRTWRWRSCASKPAVN
jgi:hypothetical protein